MIPPILYPFVMFVARNSQTILGAFFALGLAYLFANLVYSALLTRWYEPQQERPLD